MSLTDLPDDVLLAVAAHLPLDTILSFSLVCCRFARFVRDDHLWKQLCVRDSILTEDYVSAVAAPSVPFQEVYRHHKVRLVWGDVRGYSVVLSADRSAAWRNDDGLVHAVLSSRPLRGRVRFDIALEPDLSYAELGVCWAKGLAVDFATMGARHTWVLSGRRITAHNYYCEKNLFLRPKGRYGFALDTDAGSMSVYKDGAHVIDIYNIDARQPLYACAFMGGRVCRVKLDRPAEYYPFAPPRTPDMHCVFGAFDVQRTPLPATDPSITRWCNTDDERGAPAAKAAAAVAETNSAAVDAADAAAASVKRKGEPAGPCAKILQM